MPAVCGDGVTTGPIKVLVHGRGESRAASRRASREPKRARVYRNFGTAVKLFIWLISLSHIQFSIGIPYGIDHQNSCIATLENSCMHESMNSRIHDSVAIADWRAWPARARRACPGAARVALACGLRARGARGRRSGSSISIRVSTQD